MLELPEDHSAREPGRLLGAFLELPDAVVGAFLELPDGVPGAALEPRGGSSVRSDARDGASALDACVDVKSSHPATAIISSAVPRGSADVSVPQGSAEVSAPHLTALTGTPPPSTLPQPKPSAAMSPTQSPTQSPSQSMDQTIRITSDQMQTLYEQALMLGGNYL